ncbi:hypothetical protein [Sporosarcina globispora]|nr:hypothetical protein [Sporosarcina globispora]
MKKEYVITGTVCLENKLLKDGFVWVEGEKLKAWDISEFAGGRPFQP